MELVQWYWYRICGVSMQYLQTNDNGDTVWMHTDGSTETLGPRTFIQLIKRGQVELVTR